MIDINALHDICDEADRIARHYFRNAHLQVDQKSDASPVSEADLAIEKMIRNYMAEQFPQIGIWGEEFGDQSQSSRVRLIVDPIDGTRNFVRGIPVFATLLGVEVNGEIELGMVSAPVFSERWWGRVSREGRAAFYRENGVERAIRVSDGLNLAESQVFHGSLFGNEATATPPGLLNLLAASARQRGFGDYYIHMLVAMGAGEASVDFGLKAWDKAALKAIVEGAGGTVTDADGAFHLDTSSLVCTNGKVHSEVVRFFGS
ncbi:histidinol phosphate phosphatase [bacterium]|nr:histidinol phosphate phosphatase [bacterium]